VVQSYRWAPASKAFVVKDPIDALEPFMILPRGLEILRGDKKKKLISLLLMIRNTGSRRQRGSSSSFNGRTH